MKKSLLALSLLGALFTSTMTMADVVQTPTANQVPNGYYTYHFGKYTITALKDGNTELKPELFSKNITADEVNALFKQLNIDKTKGIQTSVNAFLIDDGQRNLTLIDSGAASCFGEGLGSISENVQAAGYNLADIRTVFLTHLHPDHACGIESQGKRVYPNATVYVNEKEDAFWLGANTAAQLPVEKQQAFNSTVAHVQKALAPYKAIQNYRTFKDGMIINDVEVIATPGHTPGHYSYAIKDSGKKLVFIGDTVHSHKLQFEQPKLAVEFDTDPVQASETRIKLFQTLATQNLTVAAPHLPFPGIGHISLKGATGFEWVAIGSVPSANIATDTSQQVKKEEVNAPKKEKLPKGVKGEAITVINDYPGNPKAN
jgi:glyoxylase-like metal-dependent hydrolase (beta-lactamase superfamily II)